MLSIREYLIILVSIALTGCVSVDQKPLPKESIATLTNKRVDYTEYEKPGFTAMTPGKAMFGALGAVVMMSAGNSIVKENGIEDPSLSISRQLMDRLTEKHGMLRAPHQTGLVDTDDVAALSSKHTDTDYLIDVKTINWMFSYLPTQWLSYRVTYSTRMRLIDTAKQEVVAQTLCVARPVDEAHLPSEDDLLSENAKLLKSLLQKAADDCTSVVSKEYLQL
ncbi:hypothetical protein AWB80_00164 [Caballeronia pedi]|uniref:Lipoprotein n=1 Tax=Caballeronia pedi TaxID=1777141 RepID=A0A157Z3R9_9BURK|nr:hypothetical protein [Caballeronia pedi]SAK40073.1 hypothetical protein AWB80_00164 [Caballeronia pedi]